MKAKEILAHLWSIGPWIDKETTVDKIIVGDPEKEIKSIVTMWMSTFENVREAVRMGVDMIITHEPTFWEHANELETMNAEAFGGLGKAKRKFIEESGIVILRSHDVWDKVPDIGITWSWAKFLGFTSKPVAMADHGFVHRYDIEPTTLGKFAEAVAVKTAAVGEPVLQVFGNLTQTVSRVGIGTGCAGKPLEIYDLGCDVAIVCDDATSYWHDIAPAKDADFAVIRVNHGTSEEPGMASLADYLNKTFPDINSRYMTPARCYNSVGA